MVKKNIGQVKKIAVIVTGSGLEYDDRVRKESLALSKKYYVKIFILLNNNNKEVGKTSYGIDYESIRLVSKERLPHGKFFFIKGIEFYLRLAPILKDFDYVWANEESTFMFPFLSKKGKSIWDLHEVLTGWDKGWRKLVYRVAEKKALRIIHANPQRIRYQIENGMIGIPDKHDYIHNYPDAEFVNSILCPQYYENFKKWLNGSKYVYLQGLQFAGRYPYNTISSILDATDYKIVVVGRLDKDELTKIQSQYPNFDSRVYRGGMTEQLAIPALLKDAEFTVVLYSITNANNRYCEPNRMYQAISLGVPVIVGCNESMAEVVNNKYGIAMRTDGSNANELKNAVQEMNANLSFYKKNCMLHCCEYIWSDNLVKFEWIEKK